MLPTAQNYAIYPQVVQADKPTEMTIVPTERAFLLVEGCSYTVTVSSVDDDVLDYYDNSCHHVLTAVATGGVLRFTYTFPEEGEHLIRFAYKENKVSEMRVFSLYKDLYRLRPLRGDFHSHSYRSDGRRDPAAAIGHYREQGYDCYALTDHNRYYPGGEIDEVYAGVKLGITDAIRSGNCVAVEASGVEYDRVYRCYGDLRLVTYAQFLLKHYFPQLQRICQGEGIAMRNYAMDDASKSLIEAQVKQSDAYRLRFFGKKSPPLPTARMLAFEEKWRALQMNGPSGKGSHIHADPPTRQI